MINQTQNKFGAYIQYIDVQYIQYNKKHEYLKNQNLLTRYYLTPDQITN